MLWCLNVVVVADLGINDDGANITGAFSPSCSASCPAIANISLPAVTEQTLPPIGGVRRRW